MGDEPKYERSRVESRLYDDERDVSERSGVPGRMLEADNGYRLGNGKILRLCEALFVSAVGTSFVAMLEVAKTFGQAAGARTIEKGAIRFGKAVSEACFMKAGCGAGRGRVVTAKVAEAFL